MKKENKEEEIRKMLKQDKLQDIFNLLASTSSRGSYPVVKSYFISRAANEIFHGKEGSIDKVTSALGFYESNELIEIKDDENRIIIDPESALKYVS